MSEMSINEDLEHLRRKLAKLCPKGAWAKPGMACRDGEYQYRLLHGSYWLDYAKNTGGEACSPEMQRTLSDGPDMEDETTVNGLLWLLPPYGVHLGKESIGYTVEVDKGWGIWSQEIGDTREEAILRAVVKYKERELNLSEAV